MTWRSTHARSYNKVLEWLKTKSKVTVLPPKKV
jgi:hypothetical protein